MSLDPDIYGRKEKYQRKVEQIEASSNISSPDKKLILKFKDECLSQGLSEARALKYLRHLQNIVKWIDVPLKKATKEDIKRLVAKINGMDYSDWTKHDYKVAIRKFYQFVEGMDDGYPEKVRWIKTGMNIKNHKIPEELLTENEISALVEAADNPRDKALIAALYESGCRVSEIANIRIKHIKFDEYGAQVVVSGKTGMRRVRLVSSIPYLSTWLQNHPNKENPEAYVFVKLRGDEKGRRAEYGTIRVALRKIADRAKIPLSKVNPHNFRHSRATYLAKYMTEAQMNQYFGWVQGSDMASTYVHLSGRDTDEKLLEIYGIKERKEEEKISELSPKKCLICKEMNASDAHFCKNCGRPLDTETTVMVEEMRTRYDNRMSALLEDKELQEIIVRKLIENAELQGSS